MSTAGVTDTTNSIWVTVEIGGMSLEPADAVMDVLELKGGKGTLRPHVD